VRCARAFAPAVGLLLSGVLVACSSTPPRSESPSTSRTPGAAVLRAADGVIGVPYRFGGETPAGFDCSGLVVYAHRLAGVDVPRTSQAQHSLASPVANAALEPGDLVFFRTGGGGVDHVGIYAGAGRFVHAPRTGGVVSYAWLADPWFARRFAGAGRLWTSEPRPGAGGKTP